MGNPQGPEGLRELARLAREVASTDTEGGRQADRHLVRLADVLEMKAAELEYGDSHRVR
jgi:hypothetical protein